MANSPQAKKRAKQNDSRRNHNQAMRAMVRTYLKKVNAAIVAGNKDDAQSALSKASSALDKATRKGKFHANKAARLKSRMAAKIKALA